MRKVIFPLAFIATSSLVACSFQLKSGTGSNTPATAGSASQTVAQNTATAPSATTAPGPKGPAIKKLGRPSPAPTSSGTTPAPTPTTPPSTGVPLVNAATPFGSGTADATGFKGNIYFVPAGTTKVLDVSTLKPNGYLFTKELNVTPQAFATGFPGVDAAKKEYFAIRYEAPVVITTAADYDFRIVADDAAVLKIDNTLIVDNDGPRTAPAEQSGPVHLEPGTHLLTIDYLQSTGNVALQVYCKKANETEKLCTPQL